MESTCEKCNLKTGFHYLREWEGPLSFPYHLLELYWTNSQIFIPNEVQLIQHLVTNYNVDEKSIFLLIIFSIWRGWSLRTQDWRDKNCFVMNSSGIPNRCNSRLDEDLNRIIIPTHVSLSKKKLYVHCKCKIVIYWCRSI